MGEVEDALSEDEARTLRHCSKAALRKLVTSTSAIDTDN